MSPIGWSLNRKTAPDRAVLSVFDIRSHRRIDWTDEDALLERLGHAVEEELEKQLGAALMQQVWELRLDRFPCYELRLPRRTVGDDGPFVTLAADAVKYLNDAGNEVTLNASLYRLDAYSRPPRLTPSYGQAWPSTYPVDKAVTITYTVGKTKPQQVPRAIWLELWRMIGDAHAYRENVVTGTIVNVLPFSEALLAQYRCEWEPRYA